MQALAGKGQSRRGTEEGRFPTLALGVGPVRTKNSRVSWGYPNHFPYEGLVHPLAL